MFIFFVAVDDSCPLVSVVAVFPSLLCSSLFLLILFLEGGFILFPILFAVDHGLSPLCCSRRNYPFAFRTSTPTDESMSENGILLSLTIICKKKERKKKGHERNRKSDSRQ